MNRWIEREILLATFPGSLRLYVFLFNLIGLGLFLFFLLLNPLNGALVAVLLAITILAFLLEGRIWGLADYGFKGETLGYIAVLLAIVLTGSAAVPIAVFALLITRPITHPGQPVGRVLFNALSPALGVFLAVKVYTAVLLWLGPSFIGSLLTIGLTAMMMETATFLVILPARILAGSLAPFNGRLFLREIYEVEYTTPVYAIAALFLSQAWAQEGLAGILMVAGALLVPVMLNLAPSIDEAWSVIRAKETARRSEIRRQAILAQKIVDHGTAALCDNLTGLINRFGFDHDIAALTACEEPQMLILIDVVALKSVNDARTHLAGDALLRAVALGMLESLRLNDRIYRLGGDEFGALIPLVPSDQVRPMLTRISRAVDKEAARNSLLRGLATQVRFGWASTAEGTADSLYPRADAILIARHQHEMANSDVC